ncbi:nuclear pore complex protein Nup153 isoform X2 [Ranitomeya imitator]|uniref:nuclear pore complex protein Nup153 isoform X2 n=1 Tax=Ranitomeya imitator TaxID=111125 RepID=UPI0037E88985
MAAAGGGGGGTGPGGKIRTRRYHLSSGRTPYSKSRTAGQQGIISRVTDTVKSIVPAWLQKYFNKDDEVPGRSSNLIRAEDHTDTQNEEQSHTYVQEDLPATADDRITLEHVRTQEDHSTSRLALSLPEVLTRPSLHRANLNFNILDSPALNCQPSTSSAYPIVTSNFSLVKEIKDSTSQHDDDNISTTSGFSSRASDKDIAVTKNLNAPPLWSPEADRSHFSHNSSMTSRKPTFNLSTFGSLSPSLGNSSVLKSSQLGDSPFYPGKTTYGGAASVRTSRVRSTPYQAPIRRQVKPKPTNNQSYGVTSSTARRILQSLEKMSSPLADARRIPSISSPSAMIPENVTDTADNSSKRKKVEASYPPVKKLVTPKSVSVSANASLYIKPSLTSSSIANASSRRTQGSDKHKGPPKNHTLDTPAPEHAKSVSYPKFSTPDLNGFVSGRGGGKMMREKGSHYTSKSPDEEVVAPDLPPISLPISTTALPKISFGLQVKTTPPPAAVSKSVFSTAQATNSTSNPSFTFSSPIVKSTESNAQSPGSSVGFTFSVPATKVSSFSSQTNKKSATSSPVPVGLNSNNVKKPEEEYSGFCKPAKTLKEGSVLDILKSPAGSQQTTTTLTPSKSTSSPLGRSSATFGDSRKQALGIWYCTMCSLDNRASDSKCASCGTPKELPAGDPKESAASIPSATVKNTLTLTSVQGFGEHLKKAPGTWDCDTCLVQNKPESTKCIACETPKPGTEAKAALLLLPTAKSDKPKVPADSGLTSASLKFEELARKPIGSWECDVCLVQNKAEDGKCIACTTPKPGTSAPASTLTTSAPAPQNVLGLLEQFKKPAGAWDCDVCLVNNKAEDVKCVACQNAKPGSKVELPGFGTLSGSSESTLPTIKFGLPSSASSGEPKSNASTDSLTSKSGGFSFPKFSGEIKFGLSSSPSKSVDEKKDTGFTFKTPSSTNNSGSTSNLFAFGKPAEKDTTAKLSGDNSFGSAPSATASTPKPETSESTSSTDKSNLAVSFGFKEPEAKNNETPVASGFAFGKTEQKDTTSPFVFGKKDEKSETGTTAISVFGTKNEGEQPKQFVFGKPEAAKADAPASVAFSFGVPNATEKKDSDQTAKPVFSFGLSTPATGTTKPFGFGFSNNGSSTAPPPSSIGSSGSAFGSVQQPSSTQAGSSGIFGSAVQSGSTSASGGFGTTTPASAPTSTGFSTPAALPAPTASSSLLGSATALNTPTNSSTIFGSAAPSVAAPSSSSVFGSAAPVNATSASSVFGSAAPVNTTSASSVFGSAAPVNTTSASSVFGSAAPVNTTSASSVFGSAAPVNTTSASSVFGSAAPVNTTSASSVFGSAAPVNTTSASSVFGAAASTNTSASSSTLFGNSSLSTNSSSSPFVFGQSATTASATLFGNPNECKSSFVFSGQESQSAVTSTSTAPAAAAPFVFGAGAQSTTQAAPSFNFTGANTSSATGTNSTPFIFGAAAAPAAAANPVPAFGKPAGQTNAAPAFGSSTSSTLFPSTSQNVPAFGSLASNVQTPVFGQQNSQPAFGSNTAPPSGPGFQFGSSNFNFTPGSSPGVFQFGVNPAAAPAQPANSGFVFNQPPAFNMGANGRASTPSAISNRKMKTARRRK